MTTAAQLAQMAAPGVSLGFKNRIINGGMTIDQRNAGASVTPADGAYTLDRWKYEASQASKFTAQQNAGSVTPPAGFVNYLGMTVASSVSVGATDYFILQQILEGFNVADFSWGTANARPITISFWVRSSLTGTFSGGVSNADYNRTYIFTYSIASANTWEYKTITIAGDTTGTWNTTNGRGLYVRFNLGTGSTYSTTAGSWGTTIAWAATGSTSVVGTNGATFYITGVQLEVGTSATSFEFRDYGRELMLCQRYYESNGASVNGYYYSVRNDGVSRGVLQFVVTKRAAPTVVLSGAVGSGSYTNQAVALSTNIYNCDFGTAGNYSSFSLYTANAEL